MRTKRELFELMQSVRRARWHHMLRKILIYLTEGINASRIANRLNAASHFKTLPNFAASTGKAVWLAFLVRERPMSAFMKFYCSKIEWSRVRKLRLACWRHLDVYLEEELLNTVVGAPPA